MVDRLLSIQMVNVAAGAAAPILAILYLSDREILTSQAIISFAQIAVTLLAVTLSTASLEYQKSTLMRALVSGGLCCLIWAAGWNLNPTLDGYNLLATVFFASLMIGEFAALPRARIINSGSDRLPLVTSNSIATGTRLISFLVLISTTGALVAFVLSAALSNAVRASCLWLAAKGRQPLAAPKPAPETATPVSFPRRVGAYLDRNPSILVVLVITSFTPLLGLPVQSYALAILIMNFSIAFSGVMWVRFEKANDLLNASAARALAGAFTLVLSAGLACIYLAPDSLVSADSLAALRSQPFTLIIAPILFGLSCGLNVFLYGSLVSLFRTPIIAGTFYIFGHWGFVIGIFLNLAALWRFAGTSRQSYKI
ncbi:hypothetical protein ACGYLM_18470 [Sulfitobacter sp. 1A10445]|uniref:hypothetical protein n=1 Tax=unclassified Sulfitobacter TaxID=196795 RepID=UPI003746F6A6